MIIVKNFYNSNTVWNRELDNIKTIDEQLQKVSKRTIRNILKILSERLEEVFDLKEHFINLETFFKNNPNVSIFSNSKEVCKMKYGKIVGEKIYSELQLKNPFKNHNGKLSPFKKGSVNFSEKAIEQANKNRTYNTRIEYYINKGFSLEEAYKKLSKRQSTFSLEKCISKYGYENGFKRWKERQEKWIKTLNEKSDIEKERINLKKHRGNANIKKESACRLYFINFFNDEISFWKVGITSKTLDKRFKLKLLKLHHNLDYQVIFEKVFPDLNSAFLREQMILFAFDKDRIRINYNGFKTTEAFSSNVLENNNEIYKIL